MGHFPWGDGVVSSHDCESVSTVLGPGANRLNPSVASLAPGASAVVASVEGERSHRRRLLELGLVPGTPLVLVRRVKAGNVLELALRGGRLSLRISEADAVRVEPSA